MSRAPGKYVAGTMAPAGAALDRPDVEAFACAFIYCKCMLVISKPFVLAQIWKHIWKAQVLVCISYAVRPDPSPICYERQALNGDRSIESWTHFILINLKRIWKAQGLIPISYAICPYSSPIFYERRALERAYASKVTHIVSLTLQ
jgi:hypothetical protein